MQRDRIVYSICSGVKLVLIVHNIYHGYECYTVLQILQICTYKFKISTFFPWTFLYSAEHYVMDNINKNKHSASKSKLWDIFSSRLVLCNLGEERLLQAMVTQPTSKTNTCLMLSLTKTTSALKFVKITYAHCTVQPRNIYKSSKIKCMWPCPWRAIKTLSCLATYCTSTCTNSIGNTVCDSDSVMRVLYVWCKQQGVNLFGNHRQGCV